MRSPLATVALVTCALTASGVVSAEGSSASAKTAPVAHKGDAKAAKPWCAPEVTQLSDHVCYFDGGVPEGGRRTLVVYLHGALAMTPGFAWMQQRAMALHAKKHGFTVVIPTAPSDGVGYVWPTSQTAQKDQEAGILAAIQKARAEVEKRVEHPFDETFVVGFSSGAYYGSSLAVRGALDVDGYIVLAGGSSWVRADHVAQKRAPVFVGVSAADPQTAAHSRAFGGALGAMGWPARVEERNAGHMVDWTFMAHGITWLRERTRKPESATLTNVSTRTN